MKKLRKLVLSLPLLMTSLGAMEGDRHFSPKQGISNTSLSKGEEKRNDTKKEERKEQISFHTDEKGNRWLIGNFENLNFDTFPGEALEYQFRNLNLSHNPFNKVPAGLSLIQSLVNLDLSNTKVSNFSEMKDKLKNLSTLNLEGSDLNDQGLAEICHLFPKLHHLNISKTQITYVPKEIQNLENLNIFNLSDNIYLRFVSPYLKSCKIQVISLYGNPFMSFPFGILTGDGINSITISQEYLSESANERFKEILKQIDFNKANKKEAIKQARAQVAQKNLIIPELYGVKELDIITYRENIKGLSPEVKEQFLQRISAEKIFKEKIGTLDQTILNLKKSNLKDIPPQVYYCRDLNSADLSGNFGLKIFPYELVPATNLTNLYLDDTEIEEIPNIIGEFKNLKKLSVSKNLERISPRIGECKKLAWVNFSSNLALKSFPSQLAAIEVLTNLYLDGTGIEEIPDIIGKFINLENFSISGELKRISPRIGECKKLAWLSLEDSNLEEIPHEVATLPNLMELDLNGNKKLRNLPDDFSKATSLKWIRANDCPLERLPTKIGQKLTLLESSISREKIDEMIKGYEQLYTRVHFSL